jgi:two-component system, chemotaxis family, sensor kinase CheA
MDLRRFQEIYNAESLEHLKLLQRSLLGLEQDRTGAALDEAFRAVHTLKGISAAMGYSEAAAAAHRLEDQLAGLRGGGSPAVASQIDQLLVHADALALAIDAATALAVTQSPSLPGSATWDGAPEPDPVPEPAFPLVMPAGTALVIEVQLRSDAPVKAARAHLIMKALGGRRGLIGSDPSTFTEEFSGRLHIFFGMPAELEGVEAAIRGAGDVASVTFHPVAAPTPTSQAAAAGTARRRVRHVRVEAGLLDELAESIGELSSMATGLRHAEAAAQETDTVNRMGALLSTLQQDVLQLRMVPLQEAFEGLPRVVREAARAVGKNVDLIITGEDVQLDRAIVEQMSEPLVHLLRNAVDHGIEDAASRADAEKPERGRIEVTVQRERSSVRIVIADDGGGVAADRVLERARSAGIATPASVEHLSADQLLSLLSHPGLSTAERVSTVSGRGVGLDVVVSRTRALGGAINMQTKPGEGTTFSIRLPITLALAPALRVRVGREYYFMPLTHVAEAVDLEGTTEADDTVQIRGELVPLVRLSRVLQVATGAAEATAIIAAVGDRRVALGIDELVGREQVLVKSFDAVPGLLPYFVGVAFLADGRPALVLDPLSMIGRV